VAFFVVAKTPPNIVRKLGEVFKEALNDKEIIGLLKNAGFKTENLDPDEAAKFFAEEEERLSQAVKAAKIGQ
jgi:tripartite-type tricarboxylate transporter receptor subunit TctC